MPQGSAIVSSSAQKTNDLFPPNSTDQRHATKFRHTNKQTENFLKVEVTEIIFFMTTHSLFAPRSKTALF